MTVEIGSPIKASAVWFRSPFCDHHFYIVGLDDMDFLEFMKKYNVGSQECKRATGVRIDDCDDKFFMCYTEDCFDPPIAIVRADNEQDAIEWFVQECEWARISQEDADKIEKEFPDEGLVGYGPSGEPYDNERMQCREVRLYRVECE